MLVMAQDLAFGLQPIADAARAEIVDGEADRDRAARERVEHRGAHRRIEEGGQHAAMHDAERIGVLRAGAEGAHYAAGLHLLEPRPVGRGKADSARKHAKAWWNGHGPT